MIKNASRYLKALAIATALTIAPAGIGLLVSPKSLITLNSSGSSVATGTEALQDKMMMPNPFTYEYLAGAALSDDGGRGVVYKVERSGDPKEILNNLASQFGLAGDVYETEYSSADYPSFAIGSKDGASSSAAITWAGTGNWYYQNPKAYPAPECAEFSEADDGTSYCSLYKDQKSTPELMPSRDEMLSAAEKLFRATGLNVKGSEITVDAYEWGASAYASLKVQGQDTPIEWGLNWGPTGEIGSLSGHSVKIVEQGDYATISPKAAVSRISDWRYSGQLASSQWAKYQPPVEDLNNRVAFDSPVSNEGDGSTKDGGAPDAATPDGGTPDSGVELEPKKVLVTIEKSVEALVMIWDAAGNAWLVPGLILISDQGWINPVFSLIDGVVALPEPVMQIEPFDDSVMVK